MDTNESKSIYKPETTVGMAPLDLVKLGILEARENFILAYEQYSQTIEQGGEPGVSFLISRLKTWFFKMQAYLHRKFKDYDYLYVKEMIMDNPRLDINEILDLYYILNQEMDKMNLIKIDTKVLHDRSRVEVMNRSKGL